MRGAQRGAGSSHPLRMHFFTIGNLLGSPAPGSPNWPLGFYGGGGGELFLPLAQPPPSWACSKPFLYITKDTLLTVITLEISRVLGAVCKQWEEDQIYFYCYQPRYPTWLHTDWVNKRTRWRES